MRNSCTFIGKLGSDLEMKQSASGTKFAVVGLAVSENRKDGDEWKSETVWVDLTFFGKNAENAFNVLKKGDTVVVGTKYSKYKYEKDGKTAYSHSFIVDQWARLIKNPKNSTSAEGAGAGDDADYVEDGGEPAPF